MMADTDLFTQETEQLDQLGQEFVVALGLKAGGQLDAAFEALSAILKKEPRLAEPRMELARLLLDTDRVAEAEEHARLALADLENHGQWVDNLSETAVLALSHALLAEALRRRIEDDDLLFGKAETVKAILDESRSHFAKAAKLDPSDAYSSYYAVFMGPKDGKPLGTP
jgi:tetratricopeptide (TPR) repeat protein